MKDQRKKEALATVFGVKRRDGLVYGIPGGVPNLRKAITCTTCEIKLVRGLPKAFEKYMDESQKSQYRDLIGYKPKKSEED